MEDEKGLPKFTLEEYIDYLKAPLWAKDGNDSESAYHSKWCGDIKDWKSQSESASKEIREIWKTCYKALNNGTRKSALASPAIEQNIAAWRLPILKNDCLDEVSSLYANDYQPEVKPFQDSVKPMAALGNMYMEQIYTLAGWRPLKFTLGVDGYCTSMWITKQYLDADLPGPFNLDKRVVISRIDPLNFFPDMKAKRLHWDDCDYFIIEDKVSVGSARSMFPESVDLIDITLAGPDEKTSRSYVGSQLLMLPGQKNATEMATERKKIGLKECWFHDDRYKFRAYNKVNPEDVEGDPILDVDDDGYVKGIWEPAYPNGRLIVTADDRIVLRDIANPCWHGKAPLAICMLSPEVDGDLLTTGKAADVLGIHYRINDFESRVHAYGQAEIERPMQADVGAFTTNLSWYYTTGQSRAIIIKNAGKTFARPAPVETPSFVDNYLARMDKYLHQTSGRPALMSGQIAEGSTLAASSVTDTLQYGASRLGMTAIMIAEATREQGDQVFWLLRESVKNGMEADVTLPDGTSVKCKWDDTSLDNAYLVRVDMATNTPGGKAAANNFLLELLKEGVVDATYVRPRVGVEDWQQVGDRMQGKEGEQIFTAAAGRSVGVNVKEFFKQPKKEN